MRILLISNLFPPDFDGGYELNAEKVALGLRQRGDSVDVLTSKYRPQFLGARIDPDWVYRVLANRPHLPEPSWKMPWVRLPMLHHLVHRESIAWINVPRVERFLAKRSYDLVYIFGLHDVGLGCAYPPQELGIPILWHFGDHFLADHQARYTYSPLFSLTGNTILRTVRARENKVQVKDAAFVSKSLQTYFKDRGVTPENSHVIPRGIEFPVYASEPKALESPPTFLLASRLSKDKGIHIAIQAAQLLDEQNPKLRWRMQIAGAGDPQYVQQLHHLAARISDRIHFLGQLTRQDTLQAIQKAIAFISASTWPEPFANTIIEALALGTPLIASEAGAVFEVVQSERSALTYPPNSPAELANRMQRILESPSLQTALAAEGAAIISAGYTLDKILDQTQTLMKEIVARERPS